MMLISKDQKQKDANKKTWIDLQSQLLDAENVKLNSQFLINVLIAKSNLLSIIVLFANYGKIILENKYIIVINAKCVV